MTALGNGVGLLERAIGYALGCVHDVDPALLTRPTPCGRWDLRALLDHLNDSLDVLHGSVCHGSVERGEPPCRSPHHDDPAAAFRTRAAHLLGAGNAAPADGLIDVGSRSVPAGLVLETGALEIAVHGWDVARSCGSGRPIPPMLALEMLDISAWAVTDAVRPALFAAPIAISPLASPSDQLVAFLGRRPRP